MNVGIVVNHLRTERVGYTSTMLAHQLHLAGHHIFYIDVSDLGYRPDGEMYAHAVHLRKDNKTIKDMEAYLTAMQSDEAARSVITARDLDVLLLRNDPSGEGRDRSWAKIAGINFGQFAIASGCLVLNDPYTLANAQNKLYFQHFPEEVRPNTLITRSAADIRAFFMENNQEIILKPIQGSGGHGVFMLNKNNTGNMNQIIESLLEEGYIIAQEFLPEAAKGDIRMMVMNGKPMVIDGKYAAFKRVSKAGDIRNNLSAGGQFEKAVITDHMLYLAELVAPKLIKDGMFLVGLDIAGDKLMEINVFSPGGINVSNTLNKVNYALPVIASLEEKVRQKKLYGNTFDNAFYATIG